MIMGEGKPPVAKEKKVHTKEKQKRTGRKHESLHVWEYYTVKEGGLVRKRNNCPRCGPGSFLSQHKDRKYCGRCGYTDLGKKEIPKPEAEEAKEEKKEERNNEEAF
jgi:small subunit ribosomal protein S27Ae